jgi:hypothetical protein
MKKWLGTICSFAVAALSFVFLSIAQFVMKYSSKLVNEREASNAWELLDNTSKNPPAGFGFYKFATITLIVIACLLAVWAIVLLLKNLGVLKLKFNLALVNNILLALFAIFAICALIALFVMGGDMLADAPANIEAYAGPSWGAFLNVGFAAVAAACGWIFARE